MKSDINMNEQKGPLSGIRILDISQGIAGPYCASMLARQGAEVVKVEPLHGDWGRMMGNGKEGLTALSIMSNLGKRSIAIDAGKPRGRELMMKFVPRSDVLLESFRPGVAQRLGMGVDAVRAVKPDIIYASITGFGQDGPYRDLPATDSVLQAITGMMVMNRDARDEPRRIGMYVVDAITGIYAAQAVTAALLERARGGPARRLELSLMGAAAALQGIGIADEAMHGEAARRPAAAPSGTFNTADGQINVAALNDTMFAGLSKVVNRPEWASNAAYSSNAGRMAHSSELHEQLQESLRKDSTGNWLAKLRQADVLCAPVLHYADFRAHEQAMQQRVFENVEQPGAGTVPVPRMPGFPDSVTAPAPRLGQHSEALLAEIGIAPDEIAALIAEGIVAPAATSGNA